MPGSWDGVDECFESHIRNGQDRCRVALVCYKSIFISQLIGFLITPNLFQTNMGIGYAFPGFAIEDPDGLLLRRY